MKSQLEAVQASAADLARQEATIAELRTHNAADKDQFKDSHRRVIRGRLAITSSRSCLEFFEVAIGGPAQTALQDTDDSNYFDF